MTNLDKPFYWSWTQSGDRWHEEDMALLRAIGHLREPSIDAAAKAILCSDAPIDRAGIERPELAIELGRIDRYDPVSAQLERDAKRDAALPSLKRRKAQAKRKQERDALAHQRAAFFRHETEERSQPPPKPRLPVCVFDSSLHPNASPPPHATHEIRFEMLSDDGETSVYARPETVGFWLSKQWTLVANVARPIPGRGYDEEGTP